MQPKGYLIGPMSGLLISPGTREARYVLHLLHFVTDHDFHFMDAITVAQTQNCLISPLLGPT